MLSTGDGALPFPQRSRGHVSRDPYSRAPGGPSGGECLSAHHAAPRACALALSRKHCQPLSRKTHAKEGPLSPKPQRRSEVRWGQPAQRAHRAHRPPTLAAAPPTHTPRPVGSHGGWRELPRVAEEGDAVYAHQGARPTARAGWAASREGVHWWCKGADGPSRGDRRAASREGRGDADPALLGGVRPRGRIATCRRRCGRTAWTW